MSVKALYAVKPPAARILARLWNKTAQPLHVLLPAWNSEEFAAFQFLMNHGCLVYYQGLNAYQINSAHMPAAQWRRMYKAVMAVLEGEK